MEDKNIIILLLCVIIALLVVGLAMMMQTSSNDSISENSDVDNSNTTAVVNEETSNDESPHSITVVSEMDKTVKKTVGDYTLEVYKWGGSNAVGGLDITLYKNGQCMDKYSYGQVLI